MQNSKQFFINASSIILGPLSENEIKVLISSGRVYWTDKIRNESNSDWTIAWDMSCFDDLKNLDANAASAKTASISNLNAVEKKIEKKEVKRVEAESKSVEKVIPIKKAEMIIPKESALQGTITFKDSSAIKILLVSETELVVESDPTLLGDIEGKLKVNSPDLSKPFEVQVVSLGEEDYGSQKAIRFEFVRLNPAVKRTIAHYLSTQKKAA